MVNKSEIKVGRPRIHQDAAARVAAFRAKAKYPGHRCDVYLEEDFFCCFMQAEEATGMSTSGVIDAVLSGVLKVQVKR